MIQNHGTAIGDVLWFRPCVAVVVGFIEKGSEQGVKNPILDSLMMEFALSVKLNLRVFAA